MGSASAVIKRPSAIAHSPDAHGEFSPLSRYRETAHVVNFRNGLMAALLMLSACATQPGAPVVSAPPPSAPPTTTLPTNAGSWVPKVQNLWVSLKFDAGVWVRLHPKDAAVVNKTIADLDPQIAALSADAPWTSVAAVVTNLDQHAAALPDGVVSPQLMMAIDLAASAAAGAVLFLPSTSVDTPARQELVP